MTASIYRDLKSARLYSCSTNRISIEVYETQFFRIVFHPICECMFGLSFLTTLNIYKDYFKGCKRLHIVAQEHNCTSVKKSVTGNLVCHSSSFSSRSCCVLYTVGFCDQATSWSSSCDEQKNFAAKSFSSWWSSRILGSVQLVSHVLGVVYWKGEIVTTWKFK